MWSDVTDSYHPDVLQLANTLAKVWVFVVYVADVVVVGTRCRTSNNLNQSIPATVSHSTKQRCQQWVFL